MSFLANLTVTNESLNGRTCPPVNVIVSEEPILGRKVNRLKLNESLSTTSLKVSTNIPVLRLMVKLGLSCGLVSSGSTLLAASALSVEMSALPSVSLIVPLVINRKVFDGAVPKLAVSLIWLASDSTSSITSTRPMELITVASSSSTNETGESDLLCMVIPVGSSVSGSTLSLNVRRSLEVFKSSVNSSSSGGVWSNMY